MVQALQRVAGGEISPIVVSPSQTWYGNDGYWSTFIFGIGTPPQFLHLLVSTSAVQPWFVLRDGCLQGPNEPKFSVCENARGGIYRPNISSTWDDRGLYSLRSEENLGINENGHFFLDNITLGVPGSTSGSYKVPRQIAAGIAAKQFYVGMFGIRPASTNLTTLNEQYPSLLARLKDEQKVPSLSWGYTAGAYDQFQKDQQSFGSLILGGYDASRFIPHSDEFNFAADTSRDLIVGIQSITASSTSGTSNLLDTPINVFIDAGVSHMWLDEASCKHFETVFRLTYNEELALYLINTSAHSDPIEHNVSITFQLSNNIATTGGSINITMPYSSFDLNLTTKYPGMPREARYFPLRHAANSTQYVLGRVFLQYAYLIADYERSKFSIHQALFPNANREDVRAIDPVITTDTGGAGNSNNKNSGPRNLSIGSIVGIAIGAVLVFMIALAAIQYRRRSRRSSISSKTRDEGSQAGHEIDGQEKAGLGELHNDTIQMPELGGLKLFPEHEMEGGEPAGRELPGSLGGQELEGEGPYVFELPGCEPDTCRSPKISRKTS